MECELCEKEIELCEPVICLDCQGHEIRRLHARIAALEAERDALKDVLREVWNQFSIPASDGRRWSGGLSVLDDVRQAIGGEG